MRPTRHGLLVALGGGALVLVGRFLGLAELYAIGAAVGALVAVCAIWVLVRAIDISVARAIRPSRVHVGNPSTVEVEVRNRSRRTTPVLRMRDPVSGTAGADLLLTPITPRKVSKVAYRLPTSRRGIVTVGPMTVEIADPFGLAASRSVAAPSVEITVLPRIDLIPPLPRTVGPDPDGGAETGSLGRIGEDFAALRPYVLGDDMRRVHWPSSARSDDDLLVRQDDVPWQGRVSVLLDVRSAAHDNETFERAVSAAASILQAHLRRGDHVRLVSGDGTDSGYGIGAHHLDSLFEYLAVVAPSGRADLHAGLEIVQRGASGSLVVVTGRPGDADIDAVEAVGPTISARRVVRFDAAIRTNRSRRTQVLGVAPGASFAEVWTEASPARAGRGDRRRRARTAARVAAGTDPGVRS